jgi:GNAT superfamily N-acetyltransferase
MPRPRITYEQFPSAEVRNRIELGVDLHNVAATQRPDFHAVGFVLHGDDGELQGGLLGELWGGWLHIGYVWVAEPLRRRGWATRLVRAAERFARQRGAHDACLETFSFQARPLYERLGYRVYATLEDFPPGHAKHYLRKRLTRRRPTRA